MYYVQVSEEMGRGLYAMVSIPKGRVITECELLVLSSSDTAIVNETDLKYYVFKYNEQQDCLVLGDGEIFNHSDTPNVDYVLQDVNGRRKMVFYARHNIAPGQQLFIDYTADEQVDAQKYLATKSLM